MKSALILHGTGDSNQDNWLPWLKKELEEIGFKVFAPNLPQADKPDLKNWLEYVFKNWDFDSDSLIVGHSSGGVTALKILEELPKSKRVKLTIPVAAFKDDLGWDVLSNFFEEPFNWEKIRNSSEKIIIFHSDNDPYVPLEHAQFLKEKLGSAFVLVKKAGHFNAASGFDKFPQLLVKIKEFYP